MKDELGGQFEDEESFSALLASPWQRNKKIREILRAPLIRLAATYLLNERDSSDEPVDKVARFHLSNGARIERINFLADSSQKGMRQSFGMMVNYRYKPGDIEANHEAFKGEKRIVASSAVKSLLPRRKRKRNCPIDLLLPSWVLLMLYGSRRGVARHRKSNQTP